MSTPKTRARFVEPILLLRANMLPEGADWRYELKLDGYRALAINAGGNIQLRSRNDNDFTSRYPAVVNCLSRKRLRLPTNSQCPMDRLESAKFRFARNTTRTRKEP